ncbi:hypothetical protein NM208_g12499 [Fusarium decemcellulare]|uniref:Uncharacterized protein n=1 Tax=Fusarium decemcellulare TaxID=57161 RepID=A0ACC1RPM1_9HYPO|nr:hypothetical protein NM208_g12499 [Fusarium decemcellulare]
MGGNNMSALKNHARVSNERASPQQDEARAGDLFLTDSLPRIMTEVETMGLHEGVPLPSLQSLDMQIERAFWVALRFASIVDFATSYIPGMTVVVQSDRATALAARVRRDMHLQEDQSAVWESEIADISQRVLESTEFMENILQERARNGAPQWSAIRFPH